MPTSISRPPLAGKLTILAFAAVLLVPALADNGAGGQAPAGAPPPIELLTDGDHTAAGQGLELFNVRPDPAAGRAGAIRMLAKAEPGGYLSVSERLDAAPWRGFRVRLSGWLRSEELDGRFGLWLRADRPRRQVGAAEGSSAPIHVLVYRNSFHLSDEGGGDWKHHTIVVDVPEEAAFIHVGTFLNGTGAVWADDLLIEAVGADVPLTTRDRELEGAGLDFEGPPG